MFNKNQLQEYIRALASEIHDIEKDLFVSKLPDGTKLDRPAVYMKLNDLEGDLRNKVYTYRTGIQQKIKPLKSQLAGFIRLYTNKKPKKGNQLMLGEGK